METMSSVVCNLISSCYLIICLMPNLIYDNINNPLNIFFNVAAKFTKKYNTYGVNL